MSLKSFQSCRTNDGWVPVQVASDSKPIDYTVMVCPWDNAQESICECPGYLFHGHCRHQFIAYDSLCRWDSVTGTVRNGVFIEPDAQTEEQRKNKICPACGGRTKYELEVVDDEDESEKDS
jgi:hypothetical protein